MRATRTLATTTLLCHVKSLALPGSVDSTGERCVLPKRRSRPGRDRRWRKRDHIPWLAGICFGVYVILQSDYGPWIVGLLNATILLFWFLFLMPTKCDFEVEGRGCRNDVYGKLRGCERYHARDKRDAIFSALGMRNPGAAIRTTWADNPDGGRTIGAVSSRAPINSGDAARNRSQAMFNSLSLFVAAVGSVASVLALFVSK